MYSKTGFDFRYSARKKLILTLTAKLLHYYCVTNLNKHSAKMKKANFHTDFLFSDSDFFVGAGSVLNIAGNYYNFAVSKTEREADIKAIRCDWGMVGQDISQAINEGGVNDVIPNNELEICEK